MAPGKDNMRKLRLRWFKYAKRRCANLPVRKCEMLTVVGLRRVRDIRSIKVRGKKTQL